MRSPDVVGSRIANDLRERLSVFGACAPITGVAAAIASFKVKTLVPERRRTIKDICEGDFAAYLPLVIIERGRISTPKSCGCSPMIAAAMSAGV